MIWSEAVEFSTIERNFISIPLHLFSESTGLSKHGHILISQHRSRVLVTHLVHSSKWFINVSNKRSKRGIKTGLYTFSLKYFASKRSSNLIVEPSTFRIRGSCQLVRDVPKKLKLELKTRPCKNGGTYYQSQTFADLGQSCWSLSPWGCSEWEAPGCCKLSKLPGCSAGPDQATWCTKKNCNS